MCEQKPLSGRQLAARIILALGLALAFAGLSHAGPYLDSAHGDQSTGVLRTSTPQYCRGNCAHCHEQHASLDGSEPNPRGGPNLYLLFEENAAGQTDNFCFECHVSAGGMQSGGVPPNRSYSYTFGGHTSAGSYDTNIQDAFSHTNSGSSHYLPSIVSQVLGRTMYDAQNIPWSLPADLNPCDACHNPHLAQDNSPVSLSGGVLNTAVSRPSDHGSLLGDAADERASAAGDYQAPFWFGRTDRFEPANDSVQDGSNLPDYNRLCTDCHNQYNTIYSENPRLPGTPRNLRKINWTPVDGVVTADAHGAYDGTPNRIQPPYSDNVSNITLGCLDCHEPHGSTTNIYLIRTSVNGAAVSLTAETDAQWLDFCQASCHGSRHGSRHDNKRGCPNCHYHGASRGGF
jgi:hypothetical protein